MRYSGRRITAQVFAGHAQRWQPFSRLLIARDHAGWTLDVEADAVEQICKKQNIPTAMGTWSDVCDRQAVFHVDQFVLMNPPDWKSHRIGIAYYHGVPGTGLAEFDRVFENLKRLHGRLTRIQVSHAAMRDMVLESGIAPEKVCTIPIGFHKDWFQKPSAAERKHIRKKLGFPESALVVGSFQKDGVGWGDGMEPKLIKGPDILVSALRRLHERIPDLHVLLTGPARGYVKHALETAGIPYRHIMLRTYRETTRMYHALDAYIVSSRQEGGPKAVLEAMASGVPLISTRVGQATDLVMHGANGFLVDVEDSEGLAHWTERILTDSALQDAIVAGGMKTAASNCYEEQAELWRNFFSTMIDGL